MGNVTDSQEIFNVQNHTQPKISTICMESFLDICRYYDLSLNQGSYVSTKYLYRMHIALGMDWDRYINIITSHMT